MKIKYYQYKLSKNTFWNQHNLNKDVYIYYDSECNASLCLKRKFHIIYIKAACGCEIQFKRMEENDYWGELRKGFCKLHRMIPII